MYDPVSPQTKQNKGSYILPLEGLRTAAYREQDRRIVDVYNAWLSKRWTMRNARDKELDWSIGIDSAERVL